MVKKSEGVTLSFELDNVAVDAPLKWEDIKVKAVFDSEEIDDGIQGELETDRFTFTLEEFTRIKNHINSGLTGGVGIFEGQPFKIKGNNVRRSIDVFTGFLDLTDSVLIDNEGIRVGAKIREANGLTSLSERLGAITYGYLDEIGKVGPADYVDLNYVVEKKITLLEILMANLLIFILFKELQENIRQTAKTVSQVIGYATGSITGPLSAAIYATAVAIIQIAYTTLIALALIDLGRAMINTLIPPLRTHKVINWGRALEIVANHLGYNFVHNIPELDTYFYLPSNLNLDEVDSKTGFLKKLKGTPKGIPNSTDIGYFANDMFNEARKAFFGKFAIIGNDLHFRTDSDPFWRAKATYKMPSLLDQPFGYNTNDFAGDRVVRFLTDIMDEWTIDNFKGTNFEVKTDAIITNNEQAKFLKGQDTITINFALGNRKDELSAIENIVLGVAKTIDTITGIFGNGSSLADSITRKVGVLKVSNNNYTLPKLLVLNDKNKIPANHRDLLSAKHLYKEYISFKSFVDHNFHGQKILFPNVPDVPFGLEDFVQLINNSLFTTFDGKEAKARSIEWIMGQDIAKFDYYIRERYTKNLVETEIEPE